MAIVALVVGIAASNLSSSALVGAALAAALFVGLLQWPGRLLFVQHLLDDWIFARRYIHREHTVLGPRLDRVAERLCEAARASEADEVLVLGHSLSAARRFVATRSSRASGYTRRKHLRSRSSVMPQ